MQSTRNQETKNFWGPVWRGLVVDPNAGHRRRMRGALWLYLYCLIHCDRASGRLVRRAQTVATDMGVPLRTVRHWLATLRREGYLETRPTGRSLVIHIRKWKPIVRAAYAAKDRP